MGELAIAPQSSGEGAEQFISLGRTQTGSKLVRKHILTKGTLHYPGVAGGKLEITDAFLDKLQSNFEAKVCDTVQVPVAGARNEHTEDPDRNIGEVIGLQREKDKLYAVIDVRREDAAEKIGKTYLGASAMFATDYVDTKTGEKAGPTLLHVAVTNRPHLNNLDDYEEIVTMSADSAIEPVVLTEELIAPEAPEAETPEEPEEAPETTITEDTMPTLDELKATLKNEHSIDVDGLIAERDGAVALSNTLTAEITDKLGSTGVIKLSNGAEASADDLVKAVTDAGTSIVELSAKVNSMSETLVRKAAEESVDSFIRAGKIAPVEREDQLLFALSNKDLFETITAKRPVIVALSAEEGVTPDGGPEKSAEEIGRELAAKHAR